MFDRYSTSAIVTGFLTIAAFIALAIIFPAFITLCGISASCTLIGLYCCISDHRAMRRSYARPTRRFESRRRAA